MLRVIFEYWKGTEIDSAVIMAKDTEKAVKLFNQHFKKKGSIPEIIAIRVKEVGEQDGK